MYVHVIGDAINKLNVLRSMLEHRYVVTSELLAGASIKRNDSEAVVVAIDVGRSENISAIKTISAKLVRVAKRIFLVDGMDRLSIVQAYALGATHVLTNPVSQSQLLAKLANLEVPFAAPQETTPDSREAAAIGAANIASMFSAVLDGAAVDVTGIRDAGRRIANTITENGLSDWLATVRRHHEGTYQHCLLVTGIAVDFGLSLGLGSTQIERLYSAAMFHDIGKARIPLVVLDKPGRLDDRERTLIETHPEAGYEALKDNAAISPEILDVVRHHHEFLDGSGYPDALCAESISDMVRIMTISDIFAALIEHRNYKPPMPREKAYEILLGMRGKLEKPLVEVFRDVALNR